MSFESCILLFYLPVLQRFNLKRLHEPGQVHAAREFCPTGKGHTGEASPDRKPPQTCIVCDGVQWIVVPQQHRTVASDRQITCDIKERRRVSGPRWQEVVASWQRTAIKSPIVGRGGVSWHPGRQGKTIICPTFTLPPSCSIC